MLSIWSGANAGAFWDHEAVPSRTKKTNANGLSDFAIVVMRFAVKNERPSMRLAFVKATGGIRLKLQQLRAICRNSKCDLPV